MTFSEISLKMLTANFRRYKLYFVCNMFSVALFYCFAAIFSNKSFMNMRIVDSSISGNIYAPSVFAGVFLVLFVPYSYNVFLRNRKHEYGILMTLGISEMEVLKNMLLENCIIVVLSLTSGLILGTAVSFVFYFIIRNAIGITGLQWYFNLDSYKWTAVIFAVTVLFTILFCIIGFLKMQITDLLKDKFRAEKKGRPLPGIFAAGIVLVIAAVMAMLIFNNTNIWFTGLVALFAGIWLIMAHAESVEKYFVKKIQGYKEKHILKISFVRQHNKSLSRISIITAGLIGFSVFFAGLGMVFYPGFTKNAVTYSPYDLVYSQIFGKNQVEDSKIEGLLNQNGISVEAVKQVKYLRSNVFNLFSVSEVKDKFNCDCKISKGKFLMLFQYDLKDGHEHDLSVPDRAGFNCNGKNLELQSAGSIVRILFNNNPTFANYTLILNDADYNRIASECNDIWKGIAKLYSFNSWRNSGKGIDAVQKYLLGENHVEEAEQDFYQATSKIEAYTTAKQSAEFFIFLMSFIVLLFCGATDIIIHFKIKAESEEEQRMLSGLYRIGVTADEMLEMINRKNVCYFIPQVIAGLFIGVLCNYTANLFWGYEWMAAGYSLLIGLVLLAIQFICVKQYSGRELLSLGI